MPNQDLILKVENLNVSLEKEAILKDLSFEVKEGETFLILGPNGAGKSVLLKTLLGIYPYQGKITWFKKVKIGYVPQRVKPTPDYPVQVLELFELKGIDKEKAISILKDLGLKEEVFKKLLFELSAGQFQRVLVGLALVGDPQVLLFDEPMTGIDQKGQIEIYEYLMKFKEEKKATLIMVSHDLNIVFKFADTCLCLNRERICLGPPFEVLTPEKLSELYQTEVKFYKHNHF